MCVGAGNQRTQTVLGAGGKGQGVSREVLPVEQELVSGENRVVLLNCKNQNSCTTCEKNHTQAETFFYNSITH